jgi:hypothetical protein
VRQPATRAPVLQAIEELARTREQVLNYCKWRFQTQSPMTWGSEDK